MNVQTSKIDFQGWKQIGPGGGGRTMWCRMSPHQPEQMICTGDMGGVFHSPNGGADWNYLPSREIEYVAYDNGFDPWEYIPSRPGEMWIGSRTKGLLRSRDFGASWESVPGPWESLSQCDFFHWMGPDIIRFAPDGKQAVAAWATYGDERRHCLMYTPDAGETWTEIASGPQASVKAIRFPDKDSALIVTTNACLRLEMSSGKLTSTGITWTGSVFAAATANNAVLIVAREPNGKTGLYRIRDDFSIRQLPTDVNGTPLTIFVVGTCCSDDRYIYLGTSNSITNTNNETVYGPTVWKSSDGGTSWQPVLERDTNRKINISPDRWTTGEWGWNTPPQSICVDINDPNKVTFTDPTMCGISYNGGQAWEVITSLPMINQATPGGGMPMLTGWNYYIRGKDHIPAFTDFAGWFSRDGGQSWRFAPPDNAPWHNNIYAVAFDPDDRMHWWAAITLKHDLPYWHHMVQQDQEPDLWRGGIIETHDGGISWEVIYPDEGGIPDLAVTDIMFDTARNCLWASVLDAGIFRSDDGGKKWYSVNKGLPAENMNTFRVLTAPDHTLYTLIISRYKHEEKKAITGGCFKFNETTACWEQLPLGEDVQFPVSMSFSEDGSRFYLGCFEHGREVSPPLNGKYAEGGLWCFSINNLEGRKFFSGRSVYEAREVPGCPERIVAAVIDDGLYVSNDAGETWLPVTDCPAGNVHSITFDPEDSDIVYVTTFGQGVWKGRLP